MYKFAVLILMLSFHSQFEQAARRERARVFTTVSFHNFKSQNFNLSVSNPKSKYVAYVSVLSQISNCQGLGRKNKHEILKTDRSITTVIISIAMIITMITVVVVVCVLVLL